MQHIKTPVDLVSLPCISADDVQQAIDTAYPFDRQGFILWSDSAPDVTADPVLAYFFWGKTTAGVKPALAKDLLLYYYNGTSWELIPLQVLNGTLELSAFDLTGSSPLYIIHVNSGGTALEWIDIISAISSNTIPPVKLLVPNNTDTFILSAFAGTKAFIEISAFFIAIANNLIPITKLIKSSADPLGLYLRTALDGSVIQWANVDVVNLAASTYIAGQGIRRNPGNTGWEAFTAKNINVVIHDDSVALSVRVGTDVVFAHGLTTIPAQYQWYIFTPSGDAGFAAGAEIDVNSVWMEGTAPVDYEPLLTSWADITNVTASVGANDATSVLLAFKGGAEATLTLASWTLRCKIFSLS